MSSKEIFFYEKKTMPVIGVISAGTFAPIKNSNRKDIIIDGILDENENLFNFSAFQISGNSMNKSEISDGNLVLINKKAKAKDNDIVVVKIKDTFAIRVFNKNKSLNVFSSSSTKYNDVVRKRDGSFEILGVLHSNIKLNTPNAKDRVKKNQKQLNSKKINNHKFILGDYKDCIKKIKDNSVDAVIVDPPYNTANKNIKFIKGRKEISSDFGEWDYFGDTEFIRFSEEWISKISPKLKEGGNLVIFCKLEYISDIKRIYESLGFKHHATHIWHKTNPTPQIRKTGFLSSCEAILWATKGYQKNISYTFNFKSQKEMHNFIETPICMGKERTKHPTQKPIKVIDRLVEIFTNKDDLVLDIFAGSGTTALSCAKFCRKSINIEKEKSFFDIMVKRFQNEK